MTDISMPSVFVKDGSVYANSRDVAAFFEKRHDHVLRDIDSILTVEPSTAPNFGVSEYKDSTGRWLRSFDLTRDGLTLLAMGFTGHKALKFKIAYIDAFNAMEKVLIEKEDELEIIPYTPEAEARMLVGEARRTFGAKAAQQLWGQMGLPVVPAMLLPEPQTEMIFNFAITAANTNRRAA